MVFVETVDVKAVKAVAEDEDSRSPSQGRRQHVKVPFGGEVGGRISRLTRRQVVSRRRSWAGREVDVGLDGPSRSSGGAAADGVGPGFSRVADIVVHLQRFQAYGALFVHPAKTKTFLICLGDTKRLQRVLLT